MSSPRHDADLMVIAQPDWWSRLLALGALVVAAAALYWTYLQDRDVKPQEQDYLADIKTAVNDGITAIQRHAGEQQQRLAKYASESIQRSRDSLAEQQRPSSADNPPEFEEPLAQPPTTGPPPSSVAAEMQPASPTGATGPESSLMTRPVPGPDLQLVYSAMRPSELIRVSTVTVRNEGDLPATITAVRFVPMSDVDGVPLEVGRHDFGSTSPEQLVVRFTSEDNQATDPRAHGVYEQSLATEYRIEPGEQADIFVMIRNSQHVKYALQGRLVLLSATDDFSYDDVTIPFVE